MRRRLTWLAGPAGVLFLTYGLLASPTAPKKKLYNPKIKPASDEAAKAVANFRFGKSLKVEAWAAEPLLAHPVAIDIDSQGRAYVCETFRHFAGVTDNRRHKYWLEDDIASRTVADRVAMYKKHLSPKDYRGYLTEQERVRLVYDSDGDGTADTATVFADGFDGPAAGIGAGVLARGKDVYFTCIPDLWKLTDSDGDGVAEVKKKLSTGYGVHVAFLGHDLHGLRFGPDGKLYFSIGDRGVNVEAADGKRLVVPDTGSVMRCDPDGTNLELVATGLRNPQELAFDAYGRLFTGDNNSDSGDKARWVYVVEGGDSGWRMYYQYPTSMGNRGPWNAEKIWHLPNPEQPAYVLPPCAHLGAGPSGLCAYYGTGLADRYKDHFFLVDFRGSANRSGIWSFGVEPDGASFKVTDKHQFLWSLLATDCEFGPDAAMYVSDWVQGWNKTGKGRIYRLADPKAAKDPAVARGKQLFAEGFSHREPGELVKLLDHPDMRIRQEAQFALAARGEPSIAQFENVLKTSKNLFARLHAIWGLGQLGRTDGRAFAAADGLLTDDNAEVRIQAIKHLGDSDHGATAVKLIPLLADEKPRVRLHAAIAVGKRAKSGRAKLYDAVLDMLAANADKDAYLRHGGVMALAGLGRDWVRKAAKDDLASIRLAALLAMRRTGEEAIAGFLNDPDPRLVVEAARATHDGPSGAGLPALAALIRRPLTDTDLGFRVLNAHFRLGSPANAKALAEFAARDTAPPKLRIEALKMLAAWAKPGRRDRVTGGPIELPGRPKSVAVEALKPVLGALFTGPNTVRKEAAKVAAGLGIREVGPALFDLIKDPTRPPPVRVEALQALTRLKDRRLAQAVEISLNAGDAEVRNAGRAALARNQPAAVVNQAAALLADSKTPVAEVQGTYRLLGRMGRGDADRLLAAEMAKLASGKVRPESRLDLTEAAAARSKKSPELARLLTAYRGTAAGDTPAEYRDAAVGGDARVGRNLFFNNVQIYCVRCHMVDKVGGVVGPNLSKIGSDKDAKYLLESIVMPSKAIAKGYDPVAVFLADGTSVVGVLNKEDAETLRVVTPEGKAVTVYKDEIVSRKKTESAMPADLIKHLTPRDVRDLVAYLRSLKE